MTRCSVIGCGRPAPQPISDAARNEDRKRMHGTVCRMRAAVTLSSAAAALIGRPSLDGDALDRHGMIRFVCPIPRHLADLLDQVELRTRAEHGVPRGKV